MLHNPGSNATAASTYYGCNSTYFCLSTGSNMTFDWPYAIQSLGSLGDTEWVPWGECGVNPGCDVGVHSWANNSGYRVWLEQFPNSGNELCISNQIANFDYYGIDGDDYWIFMSDNPAKCT